jgi:hypothetical protein
MKSGEPGFGNTPYIDFSFARKDQKASHAVTFDHFSAIHHLCRRPSLDTTESFLGTKQDLVHAPNDGIKLRAAV